MIVVTSVCLLGFFARTGDPKQQKCPATLKKIAKKIVTGGDIGILEWVSGLG
jgi:hypothetical protein